MTSTTNGRIEEDGSWEPAWASRLYGVLAPVYDGMRAVWSSWTRRVEADLDGLFAERIGSGARILELAPGTGINVDRLLRRAPDFGSYLGIDISPAMLQHARARAGADPRMTLRDGNAMDLSGLDGEFDFIVSTWLLSHLDAPEAVIRSAIEKLSPTGTAVFAFSTAPETWLIRWALAGAYRLFRARFVDLAPIESIPGLERLTRSSGGLATIAVFRGSRA